MNKFDGKKMFFVPTVTSLSPTTGSCGEPSFKKIPCKVKFGQLFFKH